MNILFAGTPEFAAAHLTALLASQHQLVGVLTQPDKPGKRGNRPVASAVKTLALANNLPVRQPVRLMPGDLEGLSCDVLVVVAYGQILKREILSMPRLGCINVHASLLPRWRGAAPIQRAIAQGDEITGVCIMKMDEGLDTGDIFARAEVTIAPSDTSADVAAKLVSVGGPALIETLNKLESGNAITTPQATEGVTYAHKIKKEEATLDFRLPAIVLARRVRAFNPDPMAHALLSSLRVRILAAEVKAVSSQYPPGEIIALTKTGLQIACGTDSLLVTRLQLPVGKGSVLGPSDLINARRPEFTAGKRFDTPNE